MKLPLHPEQIPFNSEYVEEEEYFSSTVNGEANIGVGKAFLMKPPLPLGECRRRRLFISVV